MTGNENMMLVTMVGLLARPNDERGLDSKKRSIALEVIAGPADGKQTDRLLKLAIAMLEARAA